MEKFLNACLFTIGVFFLTVGIYVNFDNPPWLIYDMVLGSFLVFFSLTELFNK